MSDVFISYARKDLATAQVLAEVLRKRGISVWSDESIKWGAPNFGAAITKELHAARCVVVLWTRASVASDWVYAEATEARLADKLLPVVIDNAQPPLPFNTVLNIGVSSLLLNDRSETLRVVEAVAEKLEGLQVRRGHRDESAGPCIIGGRRFDVRLDRHDARDRTFLPGPVLLPNAFPDAAFLAKMIDMFRRQALSLDTGLEGACVAFAAANVINWLRLQRSIGHASSSAISPISIKMLWHFACLYEGPELDECGVSCRSVLAGWRRNGVCHEALWPFRRTKGKSEYMGMTGWQQDAARQPLAAYYRIQADQISDMHTALVQSGALLVSLTAHNGWLQTTGGRRSGSHISTFPTIAAAEKGSSIGGHAVAVIGYNEKGFIILNSWGTDWGLSGFALLPYNEWVRHGMDAWLPVPGVPIVLPD